MKSATLVTFVLVCLIALLHVVRLVLRVQVSVGGTVVPMWASAVAAVVFAGLAWAFWGEHKPPR